MKTYHSTIGTFNKSFKKSSKDFLKKSNNTKSLEEKTPGIFVTSESEFKKSGFQKNLPLWLAERLNGALSRFDGEVTGGSRLFLPDPNGSSDFVIAVLKDKLEPYFLLEFARDTIKAHLTKKMKNLSLVIETGNFSTTLVADAFSAALHARIHSLPEYGKRAEKPKPYLLSEVTLVSKSKKDLHAFEQSWIKADGTHLARSLAMIPPNFLNSKTYGEKIRDLCKENGIHFKFHSNTELRKMGAGAFTAVDQGDPDSSGGIYELSYSPKPGKKSDALVFVGKGLCFDTGGYDVKTGGYMAHMKGDMQGSAVALACLITAKRLGLKKSMKAFLGVTENHLSPKAYKADEVITALNGLSIEVVNTDAEGRMVLADTLTLASRAGAKCVIDFATLTGSAVRSIGTKYSAGFTNEESLHEKIRSAGTKSGERIWTFPIDDSFSRQLESKVADTLQCLKGPGPDHILAACFLSKFVEKDVPWVHIDLSASEGSDGVGAVDSFFSGFGVRWAMEFIKVFS